jgi:hypothetical protein
MSFIDGAMSPSLNSQQRPWAPVPANRRPSYAVIGAASIKSPATCRARMSAPAACLRVTSDGARELGIEGAEIGRHSSVIGIWVD